MGDYWLSTRSPGSMFRQPYQTPELGAFLRENVGIDPSILALEAGVCPAHLMAYQRKLGLRKLTGNRPAKTKR